MRSVLLFAAGFTACEAQLYGSWTLWGLTALALITAHFPRAKR